VTTFRLEWVCLPTAWIEAGGLKKLKWAKNGANQVAALLTLMVIAQHAEQSSGLARLTYDQLCRATGLSRSKQAAGLRRLLRLKLLARAPALGQSGYQLLNFDPTAPGWGKLPAKRLYRDDGSAPVFGEFKLRSLNELNALKIYLLFVARRNHKTNFVNLSYDKIEGYSGVERARIKSALNMLAALNMVHVDHVKSTVSEAGVANAYRIVHIDPYFHMGTAGRRMEPSDFDDALFGA
jgi:hypothetical protein